jgi:cell wall-associated NlpC family hydrolase
MNRFTSLWPFASVLIMLAGCSSTTPRDELGTSAGAIPVALAMKGVPYRYGGETPGGFDCSGLVYYSYMRAGLTVPRDSHAQYAHTIPLRRSALSRGNLVFFRTQGGRVLHVGIYLGRGRFIHAPSSGERVSIASLDDSYWSKHFLRGGRLVE